MPTPGIARRIAAARPVTICIWASWTLPHVLDIFRPSSKPRGGQLNDVLVIRSEDGSKAVDLALRGFVVEVEWVFWLRFAFSKGVVEISSGLSFFRWRKRRCV